MTYRCIDCHRTSIQPPADAPAWFEELWPLEGRVLPYPLDADHESKDLTDNDPDHLNWRCRPCHKDHDKVTGLGESTIAPREVF